MTAAGIVWVGPSPEAIERMGDKIAAKTLAEEADVPTLPGSEDPKQADAVGYPLLVKAAAGGGGKGMRIVVESAEALSRSRSPRRNARRPAASATTASSSSATWRGRATSRSRSWATPTATWSTWASASARSSGDTRRSWRSRPRRASTPPCASHGRRGAAPGPGARYQSAGTVEFLVDDDTGEFFFLEVNTRLQVEHPITEAVTGIDLVREQLRIAAGEPLGYDQDDVTFTGSAIEARLYAEDPANDFLPATGTLAAFEPAPSPEVRWDSGVATGSVIGTDFDPMLAKVIAFGPTREPRPRGGSPWRSSAATSAGRHHQPRLPGGDAAHARSSWPATPPRTSSSGSGRRARSSSPTTSSTGAPDRGALDPGCEPRRGAGAGRRAQRLAQRAHARPAHRLPSRRARSSPSLPQPTRRALPLRRRYERARPRLERDGIDVEIDGRRQPVAVTRRGDRILVHGPLGDVELRIEPRFVVPGGEGVSGGFVARMPGKVIDLRVAVGDTVRAGETLLVLEAMKMEHPMSATEDGVVSEVRVALGEQVESGALLLVVEPAERERVKGES